MLTVVILSEGAHRVFDGARTYFEPFEQAGRLVFVEWNQRASAFSLTDALPGLREAIRGHAAWRAVVVESDGAPAHPAQRTTAENPFDYLDNLGAHRTLLNLEDSKHPLVRLSHALLGYPAMSAKGFSRVLRYEQADPDSGAAREVVRTEEELEAAGTTLQGALRAALRDDTCFDAQIQLRELPYTPQETEAHDRLAERYRVLDVRPTEVVFVATRHPVETDPRVQLERAWRTDGDLDASRFVERNDYPPSSRFAVYDLPNPHHSTYEQDLLSFWLAVLCLAVNALPPSAFQADRAYRVDVEVGSAVLGAHLNDHLGRLTAVREHLTQLIRSPERPPEATVEDKVQPQRIHVEFDRLGGDELAVGTGGYGLAADVPRAELPRWQSEVARLSADADEFVRRPRRLLARSVWETRAKARAYLEREIDLSDIEREEVEDELQRRMARLAEPATADILDRDRLRALIADHDQAITRHLRQRLRARVIGIAFAVVLGVWALGLAPYVVLAAAKPAGALAGSLLVVVVLLVLVALSALAALVVLRMRLLRLLRRCNAALRDFSVRVTSGAVVFAQYLSDLATYRHARALLIGASNRRRRDDGRTRRLADLRERIDVRIDAEKRLVTALGGALAIQRTPGGALEFDPDDRRAVAALFWLPIGEGRATFNRSGDRVDAPYDFITALTVERIRLFESAPAVRPATGVLL